MTINLNKPMTEKEEKEFRSQVRDTWKNSSNSSIDRNIHICMRMKKQFEIRIEELQRILNVDYKSRQSNDGD